MTSTPNVDLLKIYLKYAEDFDSFEPIISLCCRTFYVKRYIDSKKLLGKPFTPEESKHINSLLNSVETLQKKLGFSNEIRKSKFEEFCTKIFVEIEREELSTKKLTKLHAIQFNTTANFIDILTIFNPLSKEWENRKNYCRFKAILILKCLKNNIEPPKGPPKDFQEIYKKLFHDEKAEDKKLDIIKPEIKKSENLSTQTEKRNSLTKEEEKFSIGNNTQKSNSEKINEKMEIPNEMSNIPNTVYIKNSDKRIKTDIVETNSKLEENMEIIIPISRQFSADIPENIYKSEESKIPEKPIENYDDIIIPVLEPNHFLKLSSQPKNVIQNPAAQSVFMPIQPKLAIHKLTKSDPKYAAQIQNAKKQAEFAISELQYLNAGHAKEFVKNALSILEQLE